MIKKSRSNVFFYMACSSRYSTYSIGDVNHAIYDQPVTIDDCRGKYSIINIVYRSIFLFRTLQVVKTVETLKIDFFFQ